MATGNDIIFRHVYQDKPKQGKNVTQRQLDEYDRVQRLIEEVQVDLVNGLLRSDIFRKFKERQYENLSEKNIGERQIQKYIEAARALIKEDRVEKLNELRDQLYSQYMNQYYEATSIGQIAVAKSILDSIAKVFLPDEKTVNVKGENITIDFKLDNEG